MATVELFYRFGAALLIGFLVGLEREHAMEEAEKRQAAGVRTFSLLGLTGCLAALLAKQYMSAQVLAAAILVVGGLLTLGYYLSSSKKNIGLTTEVAAVLVFLAGALCYSGNLALAVAIGVACTALLSLKLELHALVHYITQEDIYAALKFAIISAIVLPVLPNQNFGPPPLGVFNPYKIWLFVVFVTGISFVAYLLIKVLGARQGIGLSGLLGGMVSSTAVTFSFARRSKQEVDLARPFALAITVAWAAMFLRVGVIVAVLNPQLLRVLWLPLLVCLLAGLAWSLFLMRRGRQDPVEGATFSNPFELTPAIKFGVFFAIILLAARAAEVYLGDAGVYASSAAAGLADLNAITLSLSEMSKAAGSLDLAVAGRGILLACIANNLVKQAVVWVTGTSELRRATIPGFLLMTVAGATGIFLI